MVYSLKEDAAFVACMEDNLDIYELSYNFLVPVIYMDEKSYQLLGKNRDSLSIGLGYTILLSRGELKMKELL